ncbi:hypothetical protein V8C86DRAFT_2777749, partial [Haematococcus lacustris]
MTYSLHAERAVCALLVMWQLGVLTHFQRGRAVWPVALGRQLVVWHALYCLFESDPPNSDKTFYTTMSWTLRRREVCDWRNT